MLVILRTTKNQFLVVHSLFLVAENMWTPIFSYPEFRCTEYGIHVLEYATRT